MQTLREHPKQLMAVAYAIALVAILAIATAFGWHPFLQAFATVHWGWLILLVAGAVAAPVAYTFAYLGLTRVGRGPELPAGLAARITALGFGPFVPAGGLHADIDLLEQVKGDEAIASKHVLAVGVLELALLTPVAWLCALVLVLAGVTAPMRSELWPWIYAVPAGYAIGLLAIAWVRHAEPAEDREGVRGTLIRTAYGASMLLTLPGRRDGRPAIYGMAAYWACDIAAFAGACYFVGLHIDLAEVILAYATGYLLTRRSLPLGGAGFAEVLMTFALHWVGQPVPLALAAVVLYRLLNFVMPALPALWAHREVAPLVGRRPLAT